MSGVGAGDVRLERSHRDPRPERLVQTGANYPVAIPWRHKPPVEPRYDYATGLRVCVWCEASMNGGYLTRARFCSHLCRTRFHNTPEKKAARKRRGKLG